MAGPRGDRDGSERAEPNPLLIEARAWANAHGGLLDACFARFRATGEWPTLEQLQHDFEVHGRDEDVFQLADAMPRPLGFVEQQRLVLMIRALKHVPAAAQLLDDWVAVLVFAYGKWREDPAAELTRADALRLLDGDEERTYFVSLLLLRERWPFGSGRGGPEDEWSQEVISAVRAVRDAQGPADIIVARDRIEYPPQDPRPEPEARLERRPRASLLKRAWSSISENTLVAGVIAGVVVLLIGVYVIGSSTGGGSNESESDRTPPAHSTTAAHSGPQSQPQWEQAATAGARTFAKPAGSVEGPRVGPNQRVLVACKVYDPEPESVLPDGYWYRLASEPWSGYFAPANSFWNGDVPGKKPYTHNTDFAVSNC